MYIYVYIYVFLYIYIYICVCIISIYLSIYIYRERDEIVQGPAGRRRRCSRAGRTTFVQINRPSVFNETNSNRSGHRVNEREFNFFLVRLAAFDEDVGARGDQGCRVRRPAGTRRRCSRAGHSSACPAFRGFLSTMILERLR